MDITKVSILHHIAIVLFLLWAIVKFWGTCPPFLYFLAFLYLYQVNERYSLRLHKRLQFEERKAVNQKKLLSNTESVRWLNNAIEKIWPICLEQIASQQFLLPIIPWFLEKYKPWTVRKAAVQNLYLGRNPPMFTDIRVLGKSADDDHLVLELGMNFLAADDMSAVLSIQLARRVGLGITTNMHITSMHVEGRILAGIKFLRHWPFIGRVRVCFVEPPYFQMTVKPIFGHGVDVTELPGVSGYLDKLLDIAFGETLVEPNMLVIDVEKFVSDPKEQWFKVKEKLSVGYVKLEILEGADMKPSDPNGFSDPYVKGHLGSYRFQTKIQKKTLSPKWQEDFNVPIISWEAPNELVLQVRDKDRIFDDLLGNCKVCINDLKREQRHDMWLPLQNIKMGRIHLAVTVVVNSPKGVKDLDLRPDKIEKMECPVTSSSEKTKTQKTEEHHKLADEYEPIDIKGQGRTGIWVHHPGSDVSQTWESRKGRARCTETQVRREDNGCSQSRSSSSSDSQNSDYNDNEGGTKSKNDKRRRQKLKAGLHKIGSLFHRSSSKDKQREVSVKDSPWEYENEDEVTPTPRPNLKPVGEKKISVKLVVDDNFDSKDRPLNVDRESQISDFEDTRSLKENVEDTNDLSKPEKNLKRALGKKGSNKQIEVETADVSEGR